MVKLYTWMILAEILFLGGKGAEWCELFEDGEIIHSCAGDNVTIPWELTLSESEETVFIEWIFFGHGSTETVAVWDRELKPSPQYKSRVKQIWQEEIEFNEVHLEDSGTYTVKVTYTNGSGTNQTTERMARLQVSGELLVGDKVRLAQLPEAITDEESGQARVALACGEFKEHAEEFVSVTWTKPLGDVHESDNFISGNFILLLDNPVQEGNYSCEIPEHFMENECHPSVNIHSHKATITVHKTEPQMALPEPIIPDHTEELNELKALMEHMAEELNALKNKPEAKGNELATPHVAFNVRSTKTQTVKRYDKLGFNKVIHNQGGGYDVSTSTFTTPVTGSYFFIVHAVADTDKGAHFRVMTDRLEICIAKIFGKKQHGSCPGTFHLDQGIKVWVEPWMYTGSYQAFSTSFSGFLISADHEEILPIP